MKGRPKVSNQHQDCDQDCGQDCDAGRGGRREPIAGGEAVYTQRENQSQAGEMDARGPQDFLPSCDWFSRW
eukprot:3544763-Pyramimonas_sp.AAC.1